ncbi:nucleotide-binding protein implicated in inhibition of septum formation [Moorella thermoacetica Y72]|uniref:Nucleotide-binding protein implicated in inhibition of septum formation n=1 Tax=Moorella thermoacetica Y72 TaxID=1325331 RepID=A0A0S6UFQ9_NEOTH|nr:nucleotide-binding protein implicated in inhibition of septum formation [Moorella thermoacetica Y72]
MAYLEAALAGKIASMPACRRQKGACQGQAGQL